MTMNASSYLPAEGATSGGDFSEQDYLELNPDVAAAVKRGQFKSGRHHYDLHGRQERRRCNRAAASNDVSGHPFSEEEYLEMNADVRAAVKNGIFASGRQHFELHGIREQRLGRKPQHFARAAVEGFFGDRPVDLATIQNFRNENFPYEGPYPWLDQPDWEQRISAKVKSGQLSEADAALCRKWALDGYVILERCVDHATLDQAWAKYEKAISDGIIELKPEKVSDDDPYPGRYLDPHFKVAELCQILRHAEVLRVIKILVDREPSPFQTITSHKGSQQGEHSDSIHMTTYPLGYLTASWVAFEDIHPDSGPLVYYPGSHRLPYVFSKDVGIAPDDFRTHGYKVYRDRYEPMIKKLLQENNMQPKYFHANKGDVLIWHANLIHGGSRRKNVQYSRKAVVCHYFVQGAVSYHDLSGLPAREHSGTCIVEGYRA